MKILNIAENIIKLRKEKGITQDQLASYLGVTKASVSKWETNQSFPDILLLPQIATFFNVSIDVLMGYQPHLSPEQIKKYYHDLSTDFAMLPFEEAFKKSKELVREYYSCYPFLVQAAILWINHFMLTDDKTRQSEILNDIVNLCEHICEESNDVGLCSDGLVLKAIANLQLCKPQEVIETLQPLIDPKRFRNQADSILIQAYEMLGDPSAAEYYSQIITYTHLIQLVSNSIGIMALHLADRKLCEKTIDRVYQVITAYELESLHPNSTLQFHYQAMVFYCAYQEKEAALKELQIFVSGTLAFLKTNAALHGDAYFNRLDKWFEEFALGTDFPRNRKIIIDSTCKALANPALELLFDTDEYTNLLKLMTEKGGSNHELT